MVDDALVWLIPLAEPGLALEEDEVTVEASLATSKNFPDLNFLNTA